MVNKRLKIENLDNLQELTTEGVSSIQGGLSIAGPEPYPTTPKPWPRPKPMPDWPKHDYWTKPYQPYPLPHPPCTYYPTKDGKLPWCAVIL